MSDDLPKKVIDLLCAFTDMEDEERAEFLKHAGDTFCMKCGRQTDGRYCHCESPCSRCGDTEEGMQCICWAR